MVASAVLALEIGADWAGVVRHTCNSSVRRLPGTLSPLDTTNTVHKRPPRRVQAAMDPHWPRYVGHRIDGCTRYLLDQPTAHCDRGRFRMRMVWLDAAL